MSLLQNPFVVPGGVESRTYEDYCAAASKAGLPIMSREEWGLRDAEFRHAFGLNAHNFIERLVFAPVSMFTATNKLGMEWLPILAIASAAAWFGIITGIRKACR